MLGRLLLVPDEGVQYGRYVSPEGSARCSALLGEHQDVQDRGYGEQGQQTRELGDHHREYVVVKRPLTQVEFTRLVVLGQLELLLVVHLPVGGHVRALLQEYPEPLVHRCVDQSLVNNEAFWEVNLRKGDRDNITSGIYMCRRI